MNMLTNLVPVGTTKLTFDSPAADGWARTGETNADRSRARTSSLDWVMAHSFYLRGVRAGAPKIAACAWVRNAARARANGAPSRAIIRPATAPGPGGPPAGAPPGPVPGVAAPARPLVPRSGGHGPGPEKPRRAGHPSLGDLP